MDSGEAVSVADLPPGSRSSYWNQLTQCGGNSHSFALPTTQLAELLVACIAGSGDQFAARF